MTKPARQWVDDSAEPGAIITESRLRAWWLRTFGGFQLRNVNREPKMGSFGSIRYQKRYVLVPKK